MIVEENHKIKKNDKISILVKSNTLCSINDDKSEILLPKKKSKKCCIFA